MEIIEVKDIREIGSPVGKKVLLFSGGLDSYCMNLLWKPDILLYVDMRAEWTEGELAHLKTLKIDKPLYKISLPLDYLEKQNLFIPSRNLLLVTLAAEFGDEIGIGVVSGGNKLGDTTMEFLDAVENILTLTHTNHFTIEDRKIKVEKKYKNYTKADLIKACIKEGYKLEDIVKNTYSCYLGKETPCGKCKACISKQKAVEEVREIMRVIE